ncbi:sushi, von Willebrand factor type A, EGF and pentraxin domain-containing protein 1 isoform X2 [Carassius gibelio]|uniref:sushi, von Willebrand factor type A, EGF and pentraxin domain-containing protein 1 isoform X2 n=1 Tax=Carassius gibelio TaxID=101364 RepID=UPI002277EF60|nr:sushi, von Willebrand factor type A, EGF and pentraxin domain-containing protein 1 isoform X2 [Carassius gibelio]
MALVWRNVTLLFLVFAHFLVSCLSTQCGEPTKYPDKQLHQRYLQKFKFNNGEKVVYMCSPGYTPSEGSRTSLCQQGHWTHLNLKCQKKKCNALGEIENGQYIQTGRSFGDKAIATCNKGYALRGENVRTCTQTGWSGTDPICEGKCGPAPSVPHAFPRERSLKLREYPSGSRVHYKCSTGYVRARGSSTIHCFKGQWRNLHLRCERKKCGSAGELSYGLYEYTGVSFGDSATAICNEGYELTGPKVRICRDGGWDGRSPVCEPVHCPPPPEVRDAEFDPIYDHVPFGHVVSYHCRSGTLIGAREIYCTKKGSWSAPPPECKDIVCPNPHVPHGSRMRGFRAVYKYGNTVKIACNPGLRLLGESFVTCGADGEWKPRLPECVYMK